MTGAPYDLAIIGGGINGCGIARDAAGRGLRVLLCEQGDLAGGTSSAATKLIHGGLRYLEHYEFRLVREALREREVLLGIAPHIIHPLRFVLPYHKGLRPAWLLRFGLLVYDHLGGRHLLPPTRRLDLTRDPAGQPLQRGRFATGFEYSDCWVDDARLVVLNARDAAERGAVIQVRSPAVCAKRLADHWELTIRDRRSRAPATMRAGILINAAGPWVDKVVAKVLGISAPASLRLVQGSHIVVPRIFDHDRCYIFQNRDGRIVFAIPYEQDFTLIGTTDRDYTGDPALVRATDDEIGYLCAAVSAYFTRPVRPADVIWSVAGVRPLYDDGSGDAQSVTRDYALKIDASGAPLLSIFGGKITTYRRLAEHALTKLQPWLSRQIAAQAGWTGASALPGGDFAVGGLADLIATFQDCWPWLPTSLTRRLARTYGTRARRIIGDARDLAGLGRDFGAGLTEAELQYLAREEWAICAEDVVWRRTKLGLRLSTAQIATVEKAMQEVTGASPPATRVG